MKRILITGSSGYIGSRIIKRLEHSPYQLTCTARKPSFIEHFLPANATAVLADFSKPVDPSIFDQCDTAFFLMHSLGEPSKFEEMEAKVATHFIEAAQKSRVKKIIYLGGLLDEQEQEHSPHMKSRKNVGEILRSSPIPVLEFRASVILGSGSTSFELIRALVERLPIMITPKWVRMVAQPIYIGDVLNYLVEALELNLKQSMIIEIGGAEVVTYQQIMKDYAQVRHLKRFMIPIPLLTPYLSSLWLGLVTPIYARVGRKLIDSITSASIVTSPHSPDLFSIKPLGCKEAIEKCMEEESKEIEGTSWANPQSSSINIIDDFSMRYGNRIIDTYKIEVPQHLKKPFAPIETIGGDTGWYFLNFLWKIRGYIDLLCGGIGLRRGRSHPTKIQVGDILDWWRVESYEPGKRLRLKAEMKLPGRAWLDFELIEKSQRRYIQQTVIYDPLGLFGLIYWYTLLPIHYFLFNGMLKNIVKKGNENRI